MFQLLVLIFIIKLYACSNIFKLRIIILNLRVGTSKNKNIDHRGKETCANESNLISFLRDSMMSSTLNFHFLSILLHKIVLKEKQIVKRKMFICEISIIIILNCQKLGSIGPVQQKN